jgi:hypothetical protein
MMRGAIAHEYEPPRPTDAVSLASAAVNWLRHTFAGLTWGRIAIVCIVLLSFALSRPPVMRAVFEGHGLLATIQAAKGPVTFIFLRYVPILLVVVATANRGPRAGALSILSLAAALVVGSAIGASLSALALPVVAPASLLAKQIDLAAPASVQALHWIGVSLGDIAMSAVVTGFWYYFKRNAETAAAVDRATHARERIERENAEARVALMQAQIEPHFLFNSLASIRRLYETDAVAGRSMLHHLSSYLASSLPALRASRSTLGRELALATAYLNVQKIRMGQRLATDVDVPASLHEIEVPPMMLATLVENAIIHGVSPLPEGGRIGIRARADAQRLVIEVTDTGRGLQDAWGPGVGLANIGARLQSEFGDRASVSLASASDRGVVATIELPLRVPPHALAA